MAISTFYKEHKSYFRAAISVIVVCLAWEFGGQWYTTGKIQVFGNILAQTSGSAGSLFFAPLSSIFSAAATLWEKGLLQTHILTSFQEFIIGFLGAAMVGIIVGLLMATNDAVKDYVDPWIAGLYSTPTLALAPLFILWFGLGIMSKIAVVFLMAFFPIVINTFAGIQNTELTLIEAARAFGASKLQIFRKVLLPSAVPFIIAGLRLGVGRGITAVVVGELFGAKAGLGFLIVISGQTFDTASLFVGVLLLAVSGILSVSILQRLERRLAPWKEFSLKA